MSESAEEVRLHKIIAALMDRVESAANTQHTGYGLFETTVKLEQTVRSRTLDLKAALQENELVNRALRESEARFRSLANMSVVGIAVVENGRISYANAKFSEMFGYSLSEVLESEPARYVAIQDRPLVAEQMRLRSSGEVYQVHYEFRGLRKDGGIFDVENYGSRMDSSGSRQLISVLLDISERKRTERNLLALQEELRDLSIHDPLTGLYNRRYMESAMEREIVAAVRHVCPVSVVMADLDHFKRVNDEYGHLAGDEVLRLFGELIRQNARASDICCRYGGEEFLLVMPATGSDSAAGIAERLRSAIEATAIPSAHQPFHITASFGVATFPSDGDNVDSLLSSADHALYAAKTRGRNRVVASSADLGGDGGQSPT